MAVQVMFSAILSGGAIGVADQYLCIFLMSLASRFKLIELPSEVGFLSSLWFIILSGAVWLITILPAYGSLLDPVFLRAVNSTIGILSGVLVPASGALLALVAASFVIVSPGVTQATHVNLSGTEIWRVGGGGALIASLFTFIKFLIKLMVNTFTGLSATTAGGSTYKTIENVTSVVILSVLYFLGKISPWLVIGLMIFVAVILFSILFFSIYKLWKLGKGFGKIIRLFQSHPKAGFAVVLEPFIWGSGWMLMKGWNSGSKKLIFWVISMVLIFILTILVLPIPVLDLVIPFLALSTSFYFYGLKSAKKLYKLVEQEYGVPGITTMVTRPLMP
jgi:hypothetical protein